MTVLCCLSICLCNQLSFKFSLKFFKTVLHWQLHVHVFCCTSMTLFILWYFSYNLFCRINISTCCLQILSENLQRIWADLLLFLSLYGIHKLAVIDGVEKWLNSLAWAWLKKYLNNLLELTLFIATVSVSL